MKKFGLSLTIGIVAFALIALMKLQPGGRTSVSAATLASANSTPVATATTSSATTTTPTSTSTTTAGAFKNGTYTGSAVDNGYGLVQVAAVFSGGKLTNVSILQVPSDRRSQQIARYSTPTLIQEAVSAQSSSVDYVSGATATSDAFSQSLSTALSLAKS